MCLLSCSWNKKELILFMHWRSLHEQYVHSARKTAQLGRWLEVQLKSKKQCTAQAGKKFAWEYNSFVLWGRNRSVSCLTGWACAAGTTLKQVTGSHQNMQIIMHVFIDTAMVKWSHVLCLHSNWPALYITFAWKCWTTVYVTCNCRHKVWFLSICY